MPTTITIQNTPIEFPVSQDSPNWAPAVTQFAEVVEDAFSGIVGDADISPTNFDISAYNSVTDQTISGFQFSTSTVRGFLARYTVYRTTSTANAAESGTLQAYYNINNATNQKWEMSREYVGNGSITFSITDLGQVQFTTSALAGTGHSGFVSFAAQSLLQP